MELSISANIVDNNNAVTIYLAISISHLPNSFFMAQSYKLFSFHQMFLGKIRNGWLFLSDAYDISLFLG